MTEIVPWDYTLAMAKNNPLKKFCKRRKLSQKEAAALLGAGYSMFRKQCADMAGISWDAAKRYERLSSGELTAQQLLDYFGKLKAQRNDAAEA